MKKILSIFLVLTLSLPCFAEIFEGQISERGNSKSSRIVDKTTGKGIGGAYISIPQKNYRTKSDREGYFELDTSIDGTSLMSVKKEHYRPFSMTINEKTLSSPIVVSIEKSSPHDILIDSNMYHLGDNTYSELSANAGEFQSMSAGPFFTKSFMMKNLNLSKPVYLVVGSIVGIDTLMARSMGQNKQPNSYASPPEVYFNGNKIAEIQINGDGQKIKIPHNLIKKSMPNEVTIKTGRNLMQTAYIDYDDIEFMNLSIEN